ncbi:MAG: hypothetical protein JXA60_00065 [Candidatus Coatesbacteria bacterium]|nr:hypothetical protein [Candidatus Coatesbacteria bacterium]
MLLYLIFIVTLSANFCPEEAPFIWEIEYPSLFLIPPGYLGKGNYKLSSSFIHYSGDKYTDNDGNKFSIDRLKNNELEIDFSYGLMKRVDIGFQSGYISREDNLYNPSTGKGISDFKLKLNYMPPLENHYFTLNYGVMGIFKTGKERDASNLGTTLGYNALDQRFTALFPINTKLNAMLEERFTVPLEETENGYKGTLSSSLSLGYRIKKLRPSIESAYIYEMGKENMNSRNLSIGAGLGVNILKSLLLKVGFRNDFQGINSRLNRNFAVSLTYFSNPCSCSIPCPQPFE